MRAGVVALLVSIGLAAPANAIETVQSLSSSGTAAVALSAPSGGLDVWVGRPGALTQVHVATETTSPVPVAVAARPDGGARVLWSEVLFDYGQVFPDPVGVVRVAEIGADGAVGPVTETLRRSGFLRVRGAVTNERGDLLAAYETDSGHGLISAPADGAVTVAPSPLPEGALLALADDGTAAVARAVDGRVLVAVRPRGGAFGAPREGPPLDAVESFDVAADGTMVVTAGDRWSVRPPGGTFFTPVAEAGAPTLRAAALTNGRALIASPGAAVDVAAGGERTPRTLAGDEPVELLATGESGAALVRRGGGLFSRDGVAPFRGPLAISETGRLTPSLTAAGVVTVWDDAGTVTANGQVLARSPAPAVAGSPPVAVAVARRVTVRGRVARVPVRCQLPVCRGTLRAGHGARARFAATLGHGRLVRVRVPAGARRVRLTVTIGGMRGAIHVRRRLRRDAPARRGCAPPWAAHLLSGDGAQVWQLAAGALVCAPGQAPLRLPQEGIGPYQATSVAVNRGWVAYVVVLAAHAPSTGTVHLVRIDLATGARTEVVVSPNGAAMSHSVERIVLTRSGAIAIAERVAERVRIRLLTGTEDRLLDFAPGIDPASLRAAGDAISWARDGALKQVP